MKPVALAVLILICVLSTPTFATSISLGWGGTNTDKFVGGWSTGNLNVSIDGTSKTANAGGFIWQDLNNTGIFPDMDPNKAGFQVITFCVEIAQTIANTVNYNIVDPKLAPETNNFGGTLGDLPPLGLAKAEAIKKWFGNYWAGNTVAAWVAKGKNYTLAFQLGIWEILYETDAAIANLNGLNVLTDANGVGFKVLTQGLAYATLANQMFQNLDLSKSREVFALSNQTRQDQLTVPEPTTIGLVLMGLAAVAGRTRRRSVV